ncbi:MAG: DUF5063 domain-containing protein [Actinomycetota bacterium]|nr:DUF5063 domain-containing protein [Actinomycetota bacterium]
MSEMPLTEDDRTVDPFDAEVAEDVARDVRSFLETVDAIAIGEAGDASVALLLLDVARICVAGAQLGARRDVILETNVEPVVGEASVELDDVRQGLARQLGDVDAYLEVFDPYGDEPPTEMLLSDDVAVVAQDLLHGLRHYDAGRQREALWWWQFTYLNSWGGPAGAALRALQSIVAHARLDAVVEEVAEV